jgi:hypothetical protein
MMTVPMTQTMTQMTELRQAVLKQSVDLSDSHRLCGALRRH